MQVSTIRPGLLVSLKTALQGGVHYKTRDLVADHVTEDGSRRAAWETERTVEDPAEHERGTKARGKARSLVSLVCANSTFGLLCAEADREKLMAAISEARAVADDFNRRAAISRVTVNVIVGRVAADDVEAVRAINSEIRDLLAAMDRGLQALDVEAIREAANKAKSLSTMLSPEASQRAEAAIRAARTAARQIVKAGEAAAIEVDQATLRTVREARLMFLDIPDSTMEAEVPVPEAITRTVDLEPAAPEEPTAPDSSDLEIDTEETPVIPPPPVSAFELEF